ncbi:nucleotidyltransferase family protein [Rhizosaccharibacter radicis]|uniref:Nucleotidyltransferase family protein n=1 Tax=Rhizosaccharibacter radicis TaxID=2782605 RepID=A0ABT1W0R9_9PROT|nr:nucleotidyltransferase family protein [Acetobacteraceae bacterium KSS12]
MSPPPAVRTTAAGAGPGPVAVIVLAAGRAERAGPGHKLLARDRAGCSMIGRSVSAALSTRADHVLAVLGHRADEVGKAIHRDTPPDPRLRPLVCADHAKGMAHSLRLGVTEAEFLECAAAVICLGDMPLIQAALIDRVVRAWASAPVRPDAVQPIWRGLPGHPVLWDRRRFGALRMLRGDGGARRLLAEPDMRTLMLEVATPAIALDFDTPERVALFERLPAGG